jgi:hypothetical protein
VRAGEQRRRVLRVDEENEAQPLSVNRFHHGRAARPHEVALTARLRASGRSMRCGEALGSHTS